MQDQIDRAPSWRLDLLAQVFNYIGLNLAPLCRVAFRVLGALKAQTRLPPAVQVRKVGQACWALETPDMTALGMSAEIPAVKALAGKD